MVTRRPGGYVCSGYGGRPVVGLYLLAQFKALAHPTGASSVCSLDQRTTDAPLNLVVKMKRDLVKFPEYLGAVLRHHPPDLLNGLHLAR